MFRFVAGPRRPVAQGGTGVAAEAGDSLDLALIARVVARDLAAFETLYRIYDPRLARFLGLMIARRTTVEEVLNDTMLVVWNRAATYNYQSKVSTWIFAIAYRTALKALHRYDEPLADLVDEPAADQPGPEQRLSDDETRAALMRSLDMLSSEQRSVLVLTYFHDLQYAEIAQIMSCPVDTVKTRAFHARRRLRALLSGELEDWL
jgi:RNA polymerase sigma-70 factor (ECF subfamily)